MRKLFFAILLLNSMCLFAQTTERKLAAVRTSLAIKIDGEITDEAWKTAPLITNLVEQRPVFGRQEEEKNKTELYLLYDDNAIYFGGILYESDPDSISTELLGRDAIGVNDFIGVVFDAYQDKINGLGFYVTPLGEQFDVKYAIGNEDLSWSAVYAAEARIIPGGWSFEMRIPYSAVRFSKEKIQNWGMHIIRRRSKSGRQLSWSPIDPNKFGFMNQAGVWTNLENIKPPLRLSFSPYFSTYLTHDPSSVTKKFATTVNGGMDVKYGISDGFTMDMTLIPDFGQVQSDNQVLNLSPFEVRYDEYRSFFNEGTELFNKGNLFYTRRIGATPLNYGAAFNLDSTQRVIKNPSTTKLINATKITGRTSKKLGIGFFNAVTRTEYAVIEDENKQQYKIETSPLTNYNILVLDQAMKNNSAVTLVNTNVWRSGKDYDANVTAVLWDIYDKNIDWNVWGQVTHSRLVGYEAPGKTTPGWHYNLFGGKFKGRFNFEVHRFFADENYNQRDLGYFTNSNYLTHGFYLGYRWVKPKSFYNNIYVNLNGNYSELNKPRKFQYVRINGNANSQLKNLWRVGLNFDFRPESHDFYEPRIWGKMVKLPGTGMAGFWVFSNNAKKYYANFELYQRRSSRYKFRGTEMEISNNYRFSDNFSLSLSHFLGFYDRDFGFAYTPTPDTSVFGLRDRRTAENILNAKYNFNNKMGLTFRLRHYWSKVDFFKFYTLQDDGSVKDQPNPTKNPDDNVNFFNIDMIYTWQFAPGSFINIAWKDAAEHANKIVQDKYYRNLSSTLNSDQLNSFSVKVIYYLDYLTLRGKGNKKKAD